MPPRRRTDPVAGRAALARIQRNAAVADATGDDLRTAVRYTLEELSVRAPGRSVEIRVPPYAVIQAVAGPRHTRGTPPTVVETDAVTWLELATGGLAWGTALAQGRVQASGERSDLSQHLPLA